MVLSSLRSYLHVISASLCPPLFNSDNVFMVDGGMEDPDEIALIC
jgi:hypothetical protein